MHNLLLSSVQECRNTDACQQNISQYAVQYGDSQPSGGQMIPRQHTSVPSHIC